MRAEVDSCWCEILDEVFRQGYSWVRLGKQVYGGFESGCGRRNILALRLCTEAEPGGARGGKCPPWLVQKYSICTIIRKYLECFTLLDTENKHKSGKKLPGPVEIEGKWQVYLSQWHRVRKKNRKQGKSFVTQAKIIGRISVRHNNTHQEL